MLDNEKYFMIKVPIVCYLIENQIIKFTGKR